MPQQQTCEVCKGKGCDTCSGLGFVDIDALEIKVGDWIQYRGDPSGIFTGCVIEGDKYIGVNTWESFHFVILSGGIKVQRKDIIGKVNMVLDPDANEKMKEKQEEKVNHPKHYTFGTIEVIEVIEDWELGFHEGNCIKYIARAKHKGNELEDLKKAQWYLNKKIKNMELWIAAGDDK